MYQDRSGCRTSAPPTAPVRRVGFIPSGGTDSATCFAYGEVGSLATALVVIAPQSWPTSTVRSSPGVRAVEADRVRPPGRTE